MSPFGARVRATHLRFREVEGRLGASGRLDVALPDVEVVAVQRLDPFSVARSKLFLTAAVITRHKSDSCYVVYRFELIIFIISKLNYDAFVRNITDVVILVLHKVNS